MISARSLLLAGTALVAISASAPLSSAATLEGSFTVAQAQQQQLTPAEKAAREKKQQQERQKQIQQRAQEQIKQQQRQSQQQNQQQEQQRQRAQEQIKQQQQQRQTQQQNQQKQQNQQRTQEQIKQQQQQQQQRERAQEQIKQQQRQSQQQNQQQQNQQQPPKAQTPQTKPATPPAAQTKPGTPQAPAAQTKPGTQQAPAAQTKPGTPQQPAAQNKPGTQPAVVHTLPAAAPPTKPRDANEFIRRDNKQPQRSIADVRKERREVREGDRTVIHEGNRTIVRIDNRVIINHNESNRFAIGARNVRSERRGDQNVTIVERPNGVRIVSYTDRDGRLLRRVRRDRDGREIIIIDNRFAGPRFNIFVDLGPPVIRIPRDRYIVEAWHAPPVLIYDTFVAPPVERIETRYTLDQVRYSYPLRERMPRVDLDVNFDTGSWSLAPDQIDRLAAVAEALNRAIAKNPREVFLIEGHTDAVGEPEDNLSLSDRRAEAVAVVLTETFRVPAENLVTQGYGEQHLKVPTQGPERANRYVSVRRITPLIDQVASR